MQKLLVHNTVSIINIKIARWLNEVSNYLTINYELLVVKERNSIPQFIAFLAVLKFRQYII